MIYSRNSLLVIFITLFFSIDFLREMFLLINPNLINILSMAFGLISLLLIGNIKIANKLKVLYFFIVFFMIISVFNGFFKGFIDAHTIIYSIYKFLEITIVLVIASNLSKTELLSFYSKFVTLFLIIHTLIFIYYLMVLAGILPHYNRIVAFDTRFGGLAGEPAQYGQIALVVLFAMFTLYKYSYIKNFKYKLLLFLIFALTSLSNAFYLSLIVFIIYFYFKQKVSLLKLVLHYVLAISIGLILFNINERLNIDYNQLWFIITNYQQLPYISVEGVGINSVTTRFFEVLKTLSMTTHLLGNGIGSAIHYPSFSGQLEEGKSIAFYGISQLGYELGLIPMFLFIIWFLKKILTLKIGIFNKSALVTIFFVMLAINGISFKLYWFLLFVIILNIVEKSKHETPNNLQ